MRAAILTAPGKPLEIADVEIESPQPGELRIDLVASGICRSDLSVALGTLKSPFPVVLGHEAAGIVTELGEGVDSLALGDRVVVALSPACGECLFCNEGAPNRCLQMIPGVMHSTMLDGTTRLRWKGEPVHQLCGIASLADQAVVNAGACVRVPDDIPLERACLLGCGVITGAATALNTPEVDPSAHVAVIGCGGVGLAAIQGARIRGAASIIAIDIDPAKLALAQELGATHAVDGAGDVRRAIRKITGLGVHVAIEALGTTPTIQTAWEILRPGGLALIIGMPAASEKIPLRAAGFFVERRIAGVVYGRADSRRDLPILFEHVRSGALQLDPLVTDELRLEDAQAALDALASGRGARNVIVHAR